MGFHKYNIISFTNRGTWRNILGKQRRNIFYSFLSQKINYYYIFAIVFLTVLLVDAKPRTFRLVKDLFSRMNESEYEVMQLKQSTV